MNWLCDWKDHSIEFCELYSDSYIIILISSMILVVVKYMHHILVYKDQCLGNKDG